MKMIKNVGKRIKQKEALVEKMRQENPEQMARVAMIQALIPMGLSLVEQELQNEVTVLAGPRYHNRGVVYGRHGSNPGSVYVYDQKVRVSVPRVRHKETGEEAGLSNYAAFQQPTPIDALSLSRVVHGISAGNYEATALTIPETLGLKRNSVSRRWIRASAKKLKSLEERDLSGEDLVVIFIDGKAFSREKEMVVAVGVTMAGEKVILGFVETGSENHRVIRQFLQRLKQRGLRTAQEIMFVMDGSPGIRKAVNEEFPETAFVQRCTWHKREDVMSYLSKSEKEHYRPLLQEAYEEPSYAVAKEKLLGLRKELVRINVSAAHSLDEGFEETLTLHRLGLFEQLGTSLKTTNVIENVNKLIEDKTRRVCYWKNSDQRQRWLAAVLLNVEPKLRKIKGYQHLPMLRSAMRRLNDKKQETNLLKAA
jgi:transposase-like protein